MREGLIIKLYRERAGLTQSQLGDGICSVTHVSKIERGKTEYSSEITKLICERLQIDLQKELEQFDLLEQKLHQWLEAMVKQQNDVLEDLKREIEDNIYVHFSEAQHSYNILLARYYLIKGNFDKGKEILLDCQSVWNQLDRYEKHLLEHTWGIYYLSFGKSKEAIGHLKNINPMEYNNHEFYYHLAGASHLIRAKVKAYHYGNLALSYFRKTNNFKKILDTEILMLVQMGYNDIYHFEDTVQKYHSLIRSCRIYQEDVKEVNLWHNLGIEYSSKGCYKEAVYAFKKVLEMCKTKPHPQLELGARRGYVHNSLLSSVYNEAELKDHILAGIRLATILKNETYQNGFQLLDILLHTKDKIDYFDYLENTFLPHLREIGNDALLTIYEKELFRHYRETSQYKKASDLASRFLEISV
jgi:HTH-type transcriptional regulator, quorum sensing regulator NprR